MKMLTLIPLLLVFLCGVSCGYAFRKTRELSERKFEDRFK
jgi:hypothetical protein